MTTEEAINKITEVFAVIDGHTEEPSNYLTICPQCGGSLGPLNEDLFGDEPGEGEGEDNVVWYANSVECEGIGDPPDPAFPEENGCGWSLRWEKGNCDAAKAEDLIEILGAERAVATVRHLAGEIFLQEKLLKKYWATHDK